MSNLEIIEKENDVTFEAARVSFPAYEEYKDKAYAVAEYIYQMDVTEENIKEAKATLAKARKLTDKLTRSRIDMKKEILASYTTFEGQVKEIIGIIEDAEKEIRAKVKDLEEIERESKKQKIYELWLKRIPTGYDYDVLNAVIPDAFERWLKPKHLNKTTSIKSVESEMTEWIQKTLNSIYTAKEMGDEYVEAYSLTGDLQQAISMVHRNEDVMELFHTAVNQDTEQPSQTFVVYGEDDINKAEDLFKRNNINFIIY